MAKKNENYQIFTRAGLRTGSGHYLTGKFNAKFFECTALYMREFILVMFIIRCIVNRAQTVTDLNDPVAASVSGTATMALILLAVNTKHYIQEEVPAPAKPLICIYAAH